MGRELSDEDRHFLRERIRARSGEWKQAKDPELIAHALSWACKRTLEQIKLAKAGKVRAIRRPWAYAISMAPDLFEPLQRLRMQNRIAVDAGFEPRPLVYRACYLPEGMKVKAV